MVRFAYAVLAATAAIPAATAQSMCYFPDGSPSPTDFICNSTTADGFSSCCGHQVDGSKSYCMSNGLCISDMFLSRGSCTDKTWQSPNCASVCKTTNPSGGLGIRPCGYSGNWTCGDGSMCANESIRINTGSLELTNDQLSSIGAQRIPTSSSSGSVTPSATPRSTTTAFSTTTATITTTPTGMVEATQVAAVGAGVGVPCGVFALSFLALWLFERRKTNRLRQQIAFEHQRFPPPAHGYHASVSASYGPGPDIDRMPSQYSRTHTAVSSGPTHGHGYGDGHGRQTSFAQPNMTMQRMVSTSSSPAAWPGSQIGVAIEQQPPVPPPKSYGGNWAAEAPGQDFKGQQRIMSSVQELPTDR